MKNDFSTIKLDVPPKKLFLFCFLVLMVTLCLY